MPGNDPFSLSRETRQRHPYRSLYAALLFQGFRDALDQTTLTESSTDRSERKQRSLSPLDGGAPAVRSAASGRGQKNIRNGRPSL